MCAFRPCISFTPKNTRHRSPTDLCNAVENQAAGLFFIYRFVLSLQEGRRPSRPGGRRAPLISIHAPARGATKAAVCPAALGKYFNSRPCERGDGSARPCHAVRCTHFNSRPCERGDRPKIPKSRSTAISIHAPARGATPRTSDIKCKYMQFQFTPLREGRLTPLRAKKQAFVISIHAPARGATACRGLRRRISHDFNSRPCERGDAPQVYHRRGVFSFQFTPLREGRRKNCFRLPS